MSVVGLAKSGVAAARLLRRLGGRVLASDASPLEALARWTPAGSSRSAARSGRAAIRDAAFAGADLVVVSPGVPLELPALVALRARGVPVIGELELAWRVMEADVIAITGTNGKTTTTALTGELLRTRRCARCWWAATSARPLAEHALDFPADGLVVAEVSSFQLETIETLPPARRPRSSTSRPTTSTATAPSSATCDAKARIFANQTRGRLRGAQRRRPGTAGLAAARAGARRLVQPAHRPTRTTASSSATAGSWPSSTATRSDICPVTEIALRGAAQRRERARRHRVRALDGHVAVRDPAAASRRFRGVAHRIERVRDDPRRASTTTTPRAPTSTPRSRRSRASRSRWS